MYGKSKFFITIAFLLVFFILFGCLENKEKSDDLKVNTLDQNIRENIVLPKSNKEENQLENKNESKKRIEILCVYETNSKKSNYKGIMRMKEGDKRIDVNYSLEGINNSAIIIIRKNVSYLKIKGNEYCDWVSIEYEDELSPSISNIENLKLGKKNIEKRASFLIEYVCEEKPIDEELFKVKGKICSLEDLKNLTQSQK